METPPTGAPEATPESRLSVLESLFVPMSSEAGEAHEHLVALMQSDNPEPVDADITFREPEPPEEGPPMASADLTDEQKREAAFRTVARVTFGDDNRAAVAFSLMRYARTKSRRPRALAVLQANLQANPEKVVRRALEYLRPSSLREMSKENAASLVQTLLEGLPSAPTAAQVFDEPAPPLPTSVDTSSNHARGESTETSSEIQATDTSSEIQATDTSSEIQATEKSRKEAVHSAAAAFLNGLKELKEQQKGGSADELAEKFRVAWDAIVKELQGVERSASSEGTYDVVQDAEEKTTRDDRVESLESVIMRAPEDRGSAFVLLDKIVSTDMNQDTSSGDKKKSYRAVTGKDAALTPEQKAEEAFRLVAFLAFGRDARKTDVAFALLRHARGDAPMAERFLKSALRESNGEVLIPEARRYLGLDSLPDMDTERARGLLETEVVREARQKAELRRSFSERALSRFVVMWDVLRDRLSEVSRGVESIGMTADKRTVDITATSDDLRASILHDMATDDVLRQKVMGILTEFRRDEKTVEDLLRLRDRMAYVLETTKKNTPLWREARALMTSIVASLQRMGVVADGGLQSGGAEAAATAGTLISNKANNTAAPPAKEAAAEKAAASGSRPANEVFRDAIGKMADLGPKIIELRTELLNKKKELQAPEITDKQRAAVYAAMVSLSEKNVDDPSEFEKSWGRVLASVGAVAKSQSVSNDVAEQAKEMMRQLQGASDASSQEEWAPVKRAAEFIGQRMLGVVIPETRKLIREGQSNLSGIKTASSINQNKEADKKKEEKRAATVAANAAIKALQDKKSAEEKKSENQAGGAETDGSDTNDVTRLRESLSAIRTKGDKIMESLGPGSGTGQATTDFTGIPESVLRTNPLVRTVEAYRKESRVDPDDADAKLKMRVQQFGIDPEILRPTMMDRVTFIGATFLLRMVCLVAVEMAIRFDWIRTLWAGFALFSTLYVIGIVTAAVLVNTMPVSVRIAVNYLNINGGYSVVVHVAASVLVSWLVLGVMVRNEAADWRSIKRTDGEKMKLTFKLGTMTFMSWLFMSIITLAV